MASSALFIVPNVSDTFSKVDGVEILLTIAMNRWGASPRMELA